MPQITYHEFDEVMQAVKYLPCVSLIFPFEPKMNSKTDLEYQLKRMVAKVSEELMKSYPEEKAMPVLLKIKKMLKTINYNTHNKSIAVFVSPVVEKIYYLDIPVEEKIIIDDSFEIRDLVYSKKEIHKYLLLILSKSIAKTYLGNTTEFIRLATNSASSITGDKTDMPEKVANFSDNEKMQEVQLEKFLKHADNALRLILKSTLLPVLVMGDKKVAGHFKKITHNSNSIIQYIHGNYEDSPETELKEKVAPYVEDWKSVKQHELLQHLDAARSAGKLAVGITDVWKEAGNRKGRLLVVEKNYMYQAKDITNGQIGTADRGENSFFIKDAVDDVIEKVLASGGDVEFVDLGLLDNYAHIALIQYY